MFGRNTFFKPSDPAAAVDALVSHRPPEPGAEESESEGEEEEITGYTETESDGDDETDETDEDEDPLERVIEDLGNVSKRLSDLEGLVWAIAATLGLPVPAPAAPDPAPAPASS